MDAFWNFVKLDLLISWPETFVMWLAAFSIWERPPDKLYRRIALLTIVSSVATDSLYYVLPLQWQMVNSLLWSVGLLALLFREQPLRRKIGALCAAYILIIVTDLATSAGFTYVLGRPSSQLVEPASIPYSLLVIYPILALELWGVWYVRRRKPRALMSTFRFLTDGVQTSVIPILLVIVVNFCLVGSVEAFYLLNRTDGLGSLLPLLVGGAVAMCLLSLALLLRLLARTREESARMAQDIYVEEIHRMFTSIRGQRHDFLNHVQVMHAMLQMGKIPELKTYMADVVKETHEVTEIVQHHSPALAAFVQAKTAVAVSRGIEFSYELSDDWSPLSTIRMIDIIKIVGNLVNNAFDEAERLPVPERYVHASMRCLPNCVELSVVNRGSLPKEEEKKLFLPGYTTKDDRHSGLGLSIVEDRVKHYKGTLTVRTEEPDKVVFRVQLPLRKPAASGQVNVPLG